VPKNPAGWAFLIPNFRFNSQIPRNPSFQSPRVWFLTIHLPIPNHNTPLFDFQIFINGIDSSFSVKKVQL
jgi:hypothetical protein